ncbi:HAD family hydrolase [Agrobacterium sp. ES01]|uniref:HAD family hydrolase n=1 Tax=Agrobacterium sp. ES01 TaxID=3420714 RepID=UPI003D116F6C
MNAATGPLVIFDCDGVLVDSETISLEVLVKALRDVGIEIDEEAAKERFLGRSLSTVIETARTEHGLALGDSFLTTMRMALYERFRTDLKPVPGVGDAIASLEQAGLKWCVASSSQIERIELSLKVCGLKPRFNPPIYSASMVANGKPAPDLFLFAAKRMGRAPEDCVVIEDSPAGIQAAKAAGMRVLAFTGGGHAAAPEHRSAIASLGADATFDAMGELLHLIRQN